MIRQLVIAAILVGCATLLANVPSTPPPATAPLREDMMSPIVLKDALTNIDALDKTLDWKPFKPGVDIARVYNTPNGGPSAAFLKYAPGASVPLHMHGGYEHIVILKGSQVDRSGEHHAGSIIVNPPGSSHNVSSPKGCIVFIMWEKPVIIAQ